MRPLGRRSLVASLSIIEIDMRPLARNSIVATLSEVLDFAMQLWFIKTIFKMIIFIEVNVRYNILNHNLILAKCTISTSPSKPKMVFPAWVVQPDPCENSVKKYHLVRVVPINNNKSKQKWTYDYLNANSFSWEWIRNQFSKRR